MAEARIPVAVITGFLGSGKSTLLARLVREPGMARSVAIVNEFGEVGLDHLLVAKGGEDTVLLDSGCLCCLGNSGLQDTLMLLSARAARGEIPEFDRVFVETSGLADPAPLMQPLFADPMLRRRYRLARLVAIADAVRSAHQVEDYADARRQLAFADRIVLSKCDLADPAQAGAAEARVRGLNPTASFARSANDPAVSVAALLRLHEDIDALAGPGGEDHGHHHTHGIVTKAFRNLPPTSWEVYAQALANLKSIDGAQLLRCKGILRFPEGSCVVQGVQHVFSPPAPIETAAEPFLVVIARDLPPGALERALAPLRIKGE